MELTRVIREIVNQHGGVRQAARALQIDHGYLSRLWSGDKDNPSEAMMKKLGIEREVSYRRIR